MELTEQELTKARQEVNSSIVLNKPIWNNTLLELLQTKLCHPYVTRILIDSHNTTIQVKRDDSNYTHDLSIYNDRKHRDPIDKFVPKLSWFSTMVAADDTAVLNYLELLGYMAKQMQDVENSEFFKLLADYLSKLLLLEDQLSTLDAEILILQTSRKKEEKDLAMTKLKNDLNALEDRQLFYTPIYRRRLEHIDTNIRGYEVLCIHKVSAKTVSFSYDKCYDRYSVDNVKDEYGIKSRRDFKYIYEVMKQFKPISDNEMILLVDTILIKRLIKEAKEENGNETREAIKGYLTEVYFKDALPRYSVDEPMQLVIDKELENIKE